MLDSPLSSSSIPSPSSKSSLPQLPVELFRQIIEFSVPSYYHSLTYKDRQLTLRNLCCTSRLFRQIAQPLLKQFDQVYLGERDVDVRSTCELRSRTLVLSITASEDVVPQSIESLILEHHQVQDLHVDHDVDSVYLFKIDVLSSAASLTDLTLYGLTLSPERLQPLASLRRMSLFDCDAHGGDLALQTTMFPSLRILAFLYHALGTHTINVDALIPQLQLFISNYLTGDSEVLRCHSDKILMDGVASAPVERRRILGHVRHFRLKAYDWYPPSGGGARRIGAHLYEAFQILYQTRQSTGTALKTLFLDKSLPNDVKGDEYASYRYNRLIEMCEHDGTEVVLEEQGVSDHADSAISPELLGWMDRRKEKARLSLEGGIERETR